MPQLKSPASAARAGQDRPAWATRLDRVAARVATVVGRVLGRPSEALLAELARADRPGAASPGGAVDGPEQGIAAGRRAFEAGHYAEALHLMGAVLERWPDAAWAWHGRGDALQLLGDPEGALRAYDEAVARAPETGLHHAGRANALRSLGRALQEEAAWQAALGRDPSLTWMRAGPRGG